MECCGEVYLDTETYELVCRSCGRVETISVAFDEHQFFDQAQGQPKKKIIQHIFVNFLKNTKSLMQSTPQ